MNDDIDKFLSVVTPWLSLYDRAIVATMGVHNGGTKSLLSARILFSPNPPTDFAPLPLRDSIFWAGAELASVNATEVTELIKNLRSGRVEFGDMSGGLSLEGGASACSNFFPAHHPAFGNDESAPRVPTLFITGGGRHALMEQVISSQEINWHLRSLNPPFSNLNDLHDYYGLPALSQSGDAGLIEVIVRPPVEIIPQSSITSDEASIRIRAVKTIDKTKISLGYRGWGGKTELVRTRIAQKEIVWSEENGLLEGVAKVNIGDTQSIQCFLSYGGTGVQQFWILNPDRHVNVRQAIHCAFDPDMKVLKRLLLENKRTEARTFEDGVAMLLGMLGFSVTQHGRSQKLSEAPDVVAITPNGNVAVVECTVGLPDQGDQIAKVLQRTEAVRKSLSRSGWPGIQVLPVIVTVLPDLEIQAHRGDAESKGVAIASLDTLISGLDRVQFPPNADRLFNEAMSRLSKPLIRGL